MAARRRGDALKTARLRHLVDTDGEATLARLIQDRLDEQAGPWALTCDERREQELCRHEFGRFDPTSTIQRAWIRSLSADQIAA